jgi:invasion protein IalB
LTPILFTLILRLENRSTGVPVMPIAPIHAPSSAVAVTRQVRAWLAAAALSAASAGVGPSAALAQAAEGAPDAPATEGAPAKGPRDGQEFQDWTLHCRAPEGPTPEVCEMHQRVVNQEGERVMLAVVGRLPNIDTPGLLFILPLGISLPPGAFLRIDQGEEEPVPVERCERQGCRIELLLDDELLARLKAGTRATVAFHVYDGQGQRPRVDVPVSLLGFSAALAEVMK